MCHQNSFMHTGLHPLGHKSFCADHITITNIKKAMSRFTEWFVQIITNFNKCSSDIIIVGRPTIRNG